MFEFYLIHLCSYRFNKPRRELDLVQTNNREDDFERELAKKSAINEQLRIREQYKKLIQRQTVILINN